MAKDRRNKDQKRKAKLTARTQRVQRHEHLTPYMGKKYQAPTWALTVAATELPIYETIVVSERKLTNEQVRAALLWLIQHLHGNNPAPLPPETPDVPFRRGHEVEFLCWHIRRSWGHFLTDHGRVENADLIGICRTLLFSIEAHGRNTGMARGYVEFLYGFMGENGVAGPQLVGRWSRRKQKAEEEDAEDAESEARE